MFKKKIAPAPVSFTTINSSTSKLETNIKLVASASGCVTAAIAIVSAAVKVIRGHNTQNVISDAIVSDIISENPDITAATAQKAVYAAMKTNERFINLSWEERGAMAKRVIKKLESSLKEVK